VDVIASGLPAGAATAANQALILAQVQAIEDLTHALQSVATDRLRVRGSDQLHSFKGVLALRGVFSLSAPNGSQTTAAVPAGEIWYVTTIVAANLTRAMTQLLISTLHDASEVDIYSETRAIAAGERPSWSGLTILDESDTILAYYIGGQAGDLIILSITGFRMTPEV